MRLFALLCLLVMLGLTAPSPSPASPPHRIISLAPGTTEMLFSLGLGKFLVGDTTYCNYPPAARTISKVGDVIVNYEKVIALHPDLIVASDANRPAALHFQQLHLPVLVISPTSYAATEKSLLRLGQVTGTTSQAQRIVAGMETVRASAAHRAARDPRRPNVLPVLGLNPLFVAGQGTFIQDLISLAGGQSRVSAVPGYAAYSKEQLLVHPPDFILTDPATQIAMRSDNLLATLPTVHMGHFITIDSDILSRPGPRLATALAILSQALHPRLK